MSSCVKSSPSPPALPKPDSRRSKRLHHSAGQNKSLSEFPEVKDRSSLSEGVQMPVLPPQNGQNYFIPDELLFTLTSPEWQQDRAQYNKTLKHSKVCGIRAPDAVWHHNVGRKKYHYFLDQPTSVTGAGRDISFLCDALASQRERISLPPVPDRTTISLEDSQKDTHSTQTLIPEEYHILTNKGVKALHCYDDKFTVLLEDEQKRLKNFPSMKPSGRLEAVQLMRVMDDMLEKAGASQELEEVKGISQIQGLLELVRVEQNIYNIVFHELIRQVSVECIERGQLLAKLRHRYVALLDRIPRQLIDLHTETLAQRALDRRLTEEIICFKNSIAQLNEELNLLREHDEHLSKQAEKAQEELAEALKQSQLDSDIVGEYHKLYELQRQRLEGQIIILTEERDLWSKVTYSIALKVIKLNNLQLVSRLHLSEQAWSKTAEHFTTVLTAKDSEDLNRIMQLTDQWKEQLTGFMENLKETENKQFESIRSIQDGLVRWHKHCQNNARSPNVKLEKTSEELLVNDLKQWSMVLTMQCERYGGEELLTFQETLHTLEQLQDLWVEVYVQLFMRHPSWDGEAPKGPAAMRELSCAINELHTQLGICISGESGIHQQLVTLAAVIESWANRLKPLIRRPEMLHDSEWSKLEKALESWINLCEEALVNVSNTQTESDRIKHKPHTKIKIDVVLNMLREFVSSQNNFFDHTNLTLCEEVGSLHALRTRWMVDLLLLMVPDECDAQDLHPAPSPELNVFRDVSYQKLEDDAKNLEQKLNYFSKYIANSCQTIVEEMAQKNMSRTDTENEVYQLNKLQRECAEWVDVCQILLCDLMGRPLKLQLAEEAVPKFITDLSLFVESVPSPADVYEEPERSVKAKEDEKAFVKAGGRPYTPLQVNKQVEEMREDGTEDQKSGSVMKLIGHDGHIIEQILEGKTVRITGTSDHVARPYSENAQQAFSALGTLGILQQELLTVEARAISAEERALKAEEALQEALEKIHDLERQLPQKSCLETKANEPVSPVAKEEAIAELKEVSHSQP
ncbi:axonemal dynein light chain domain-containing protein 1 [Clarias gariepinus]|uniref:axonemal dynein light chain domain-containing protein 1 n=1 Tax=Clarias gariepinus TaxID=13013 RepID=UPI00234C5FB9|nr:axonemal dynein light chain domain-containing protein 1 [Clarias gariepinus]